MLSISSKVISRRIFYAFRSNCIKTINTFGTNKLEKTLNTKQNQFQNIRSQPIGFEQRLHRIEDLVRREGRVSPMDINLCLNELSKSERVRPTTTQSLFLIRSCGALPSDESRETRKDLCQRLFDTLLKNSEFDVSHYNQLLRVYVVNQFDFNPIDFLEQMQSNGIVPNRVTFVLMIDRFCQTGNVSEAIKILKHMESEDMFISEPIFNSLIFGYGKAGNLQMVEQTITQMKASGLEPTAQTYTALLSAYAMNIENPESEQKINDLLEEVNRTETVLSETNLFEVLKHIALVDSESKLFDELFNKINSNKSINYNKNCLNVINDLLSANKVEVALRLYESMVPPETQVRRKTVGNAMIRSMIRTNISPKTVIGFCEKLQKEEKNSFALRYATEVALSSANLSDSRAYLKHFSLEAPLRVHYFYPIIIKCQTEDQIFDVLSEDMALLSGSYYSALNELFADYIWTKKILDIDLFIEKCKAIGFSYAITFNSLIRYYIANKRYEEVFDLLSSPKYSSVILRKRDLINGLIEGILTSASNVPNIVRVLKAVSNNPQRFTRNAEESTDILGEFLLALSNKRVSQNLLNDVLKACNKLSVKVSKSSVDAISDRITLSPENEDLLSKLRLHDGLRGVSYYNANDFTKPRHEMNLEELENNLIELRSKGLNTRGLLRTLLLAYCRRTKFTDDAKNDKLVIESQNRVKQLLKELEENEFEFTNAMFASLMEFYTNCGDIESALEYRNKISDDFQIDSFKVFNLAHLYVKNGDISKAIDLIKTEKSRRVHSNESEELQSHQFRTKDMSIYRLLNSLIDAKVEPKFLKEVFELCIDYSSMVPTSVMAGPLVKIHIQNQDFAKALEEFEYCVNNYGITPWKSQLFQHFIEKEDQISLQTVVEHSHEIHGEMNTIVELAAICVEMGKTKQAVKLLSTPGLRVKPQKLDFISETFIKSGKLDEFEQFIRLSKNVFDMNCDRLVYHLIRGCIATQNTEKALNCWTLIQEEDIQPSDNTLILLANFLEQNNITVPFVVPPNPDDKPIDSSELQTEVDVQSRRPVDDINIQFNIAIKRSDITEALRLKKVMESKGKTLLMSQNCSLIEALLNADRIDDGFELSKSLMESKLFPAPRIINYLLSKLSSIGDYRRIEELQPILPEFLLQHNSFTNSLGIAYINSGKTEELLNEKLVSMKPFPLGAFLKILNVNPELEQRLQNIANDLIRESDFHLPLNMIWLNCMKTGRFVDADKIYDSCPKFKDFLLFTSLLDEIRNNKNIVLAQKLADVISKSNLTSKSIGIAYSALIDAHMELGQIALAEEVVINDVMNAKVRIDPKTQTEIKLLEVEHLNRSTVHRLVKSIRETEHREPRFSLTFKNNSSTVVDSSASVDSSTGSSSSDEEEVVDVKTK